jgi:hypothetical protein
MNMNLKLKRTTWLMAALITPLLSLSLAGNAVAGKIYRCVDDKKKVTVSDTPCVTPAATNGDADKSKTAPADAAKKDDKSGAPPPKKDAKS